MPAKANFNTQTIAHIIIDDKNIKMMLELIRRLRSKQFPAAIKYHFAHGSRLVELEHRAQQIIKKNIYDAWDNPDRTYALFDSFKVEEDDGAANEGAIALYSDPAVAEAWGDPAWSYAAFFEMPAKEGGYNTFIAPRGIASRPINYRPFFAALEKLMELRGPEHARASVISAIVELVPNELAYKLR